MKKLLTICLLLGTTLAQAQTNSTPLKVGDAIPDVKLRTEENKDPRQPDGDGREQDMKRDIQPELGPREEEGIAGIHQG